MTRGNVIDSIDQGLICNSIYLTSGAQVVLPCNIRAFTPENFIFLVQNDHVTRDDIKQKLVRGQDSSIKVVWKLNSRSSTKRIPQRALVSSPPTQPTQMPHDLKRAKGQQAAHVAYFYVSKVDLSSRPAPSYM